jgi:hypothetical protein
MVGGGLGACSRSRRGEAQAARLPREGREVVHGALEQSRAERYSDVNCLTNKVSLVVWIVQLPQSTSDASHYCSL